MDSVNKQTKINKRNKLMKIMKMYLQKGKKKQKWLRKKSNQIILIKGVIMTHMVP